jgi:hypothetical protein
LPLLQADVLEALQELACQRPEPVDAGIDAAPAANVDGVCEAPSLTPVPELAADRW